MALAITIQRASSSGGVLDVTYSRNADGGGYGVSWPAGSLDDYTLTEGDLEQFLLRAILTWARRRGVTAAQLVGKTFTLDLGSLANLITVS